MSTEKTLLLLILVALVVFATLFFLHTQDARNIAAVDLQCEYMTDPLGIDVERPRLSWKLSDPLMKRGQHQTAYRIIVAGSLGSLHRNNADVWDSGTVSSEQSTLVPCGSGDGNSPFSILHSQSVYYWKVMVYDVDGKPSAWSKPARFATGLPDRKDWHGEWIKHPTASREKHIIFRKSFHINRTAVRALACVASMGYHELYVNGRKADDGVLSPAVSRMDKRVLYRTYDVAPLLHKGDNTVALIYGPGWSMNNYFARSVNQAVLVQLNGDSFDISSDDAWTCSESYSRNIGGFGFMDMGGEEVDGNRFTDDCIKPGYDDSDWKKAMKTSPLKNGGEPILSAQMTDRSRIVRTIPAQSITDTVPGVFRADMGEHFTGFLQARFYGLKKGDTVRITVSERTCATLEATTVIGDDVIEEHRQRHVYIARGEDGEMFRNRFNFFGGRYIHFAGLNRTPSADDITGYAVSSAPRRTGCFECSDSVYNRIHEVDRNTFEMCHTDGVIVDCPNRERLGYGPEGAYQTTWGMGLPCYASAAYYMKNVRDWSDVQRADGSINNVAPQISSMYGCTLNGTAILNIAYEHYLMYGDKTVILQSLPVGLRWLEYLRTYVKDGLLTPYDRGGYFLGDWVSPGPVFEYAETEEALFFNNCAYAMTLDLYVKLSEIAGGCEAPASHTINLFRRQLDSLRIKLHAKYYRPEINSYLNGDQVRTTFALFAGIVPDTLRPLVLEHLREDMSREHPYINVGSFGRYPFYKTLISEPSFYELFDGILSRSDYPGYGYFLSKGHNTWPETWEINSPNSAVIHTSYAGISAWFIRGLCGIDADSDGRLTIRPNVVSRLSYARAEVETPYGLVRSGWHKSDDGSIIYDITIPPGAKAAITLPASADRITESNLPLAYASEDVSEYSADRTIITASAGKYQFKLQN